MRKNRVVMGLRLAVPALACVNLQSPRNTCYHLAIARG